MALAKMTTKGQVTIPQEIRESLNLKAGDKLDISISENGEAIIRPIVRKVDEVYCLLKNENLTAKTTEEIDQALKNRFLDKYK